MKTLFICIAVILIMASVVIVQNEKEPSVLMVAVVMSLTAGFMIRYSVEDDL